MIGSGGDGGGKQVEQADSIGKSIEERSAAWQSRAFRRVPDGVRDRELFGVWKARADVRSRRKSTQPAGSTRQMLLSIYLNTHGDLQNEQIPFHYARSLLPNARLAGTAMVESTAPPHSGSRGTMEAIQGKRSRFSSRLLPRRPVLQLATAMHAASAAARARARGPVIKWTTPWLLNRPPIRPFSIGSPLYGDGQAKAAQAITTETLATRLKQKRSADIQSPSSHDHAASPSSAGSSRATPTTAKASDQSHKGPHKIRVPATAKGDQAAGEARKDRKRAPIEGFKAKRFAMQRLRREQAQAVAEAHDGDWLADEVSRVSVLLRLFWPAFKLSSSIPPINEGVDRDLTHLPCTAQEPL